MSEKPQTLHKRSRYASLLAYFCKINNDPPHNFCEYVKSPILRENVKTKK